MTDVTQATASQETGPQRTVEGTLIDQSTLDQSKANTSQDSLTKSTETPAPAKEGATLLSKEEPAKEGDKPATKEGAPEKYADYKVPEGFKLDDEAKAKADAVFKELGLSQDAAQKLVDLNQDLLKEVLAAPIKAYQDMIKTWGEESMNHPDLKGKVGPGKEVSVRIGKMLDSLGDPELASAFRSQMDLTGVGNHQAFIRVLDRLAQRVTEGSHVAGNGPSKAGQSRPGDGPPSAGAAMWPNLPSAANRQ